MTDMMDLNAETAAAAGTKHKVALTFDVKQDGQPFLDMAVNYANCSDAIVAQVTGMTVEMAGALGQKGAKPKGGSFTIVMSLSVDGAQKAGGTWDGLTREQALAFEKHVLKVWDHANDNSAIANKAQGKI